jgi:hypothetical protein
MLNIPVKINDPAVVVALKVLNIVPLQQFSKQERDSGFGV